MGDTKSRAKVSVALIGVGPTWELHYRDAVEQLTEKISVRAVCDSVLMRAAAVADEFETSPVGCPWLLTQRQDLHAWLILDPGWFDAYPADLATRYGRPALFANTFAGSLPRVTEILKRSRELGETLMPEFPQRFTPTTTRLRELIASKLGRVQRIELSLPLAAASPSTVANWLTECQSEAIGLFDWCACLIGSPISGITFHATSSGPQFDLTFPPRSASPDTAGSATLRFGSSPEAIRQIQCERGAVTIHGPTQLAWSTPDQQAEETLGHERSPYEIILDQFCRRALGGLVPVPTVTDALQAIATAQQALACVKSMNQ